MSLSVITVPAQLTEDMDVARLLLIKTSNNHLEILAQSLRASSVNLLDPNDGRKVVITLSVNQSTGSIDYKMDFITP